MLQTSAQIVSTQSLLPEMGARFRFWASRPSLPAAWLALLLTLTKSGDVESNPGLTTHKNKHTPVIWICDLCHKQINKKQTSIRCNHTHNTHWVHLKYIQIKQRQYKPDWRCTIHTPTQNVTTPSTTHHKQTTTNRGTKKPRTQHLTGHQRNTGNKTHTESKNIPLHHHTHRQRAQTGRGLLLSTHSHDPC